MEGEDDRGAPVTTAAAPRPSETELAIVPQSPGGHTILLSPLVRLKSDPRS
jgi:hypothetical protein